MPLSLAEIAATISAGDPPGSLHATILFRQTLAVDPDPRDEGGRAPIVFVPDLHLLSLDRGVGYGDYFHLNQARKATLVAVLLRFYELRVSTPEFGSLKVYQLGDLHDLWREAQHWWGEDTAAMLARQLADHADLFALLADLEAERLAGNHDRALRSASVRAEIAGAPISSYLPLDRLHSNARSFLWGPGCRIDLIHGDQVDDAETPWYRRPINPIGARFAEHGALDIGDVDEWQHEVSPAGNADEGLLQPVVRWGDPAAQAARTKFFPELRDYETCAADASADARGAVRAAVVIGHTHAPRIVVDGPPVDFTLIDCGSWVNQSQANGDPKDVFWNGQLGVLTGNEAGILQIGP